MSVMVSEIIDTLLNSFTRLRTKKTSNSTLQSHCEGTPVLWSIPCHNVHMCQLLCPCICKNALCGIRLIIHVLLLAYALNNWLLWWYQDCNVTTLNFNCFRVCLGSPEQEQQNQRSALRPPHWSNVTGAFIRRILLVMWEAFPCQMSRRLHSAQNS